jgi:hypothetical protein
MLNKMQEAQRSLRVPRCGLPCTGATFSSNGSAAVAIVGLGTQPGGNL